MAKKNRGYTEKEKNDIFDKVIEDIINGLSVRRILKREGMPSYNHLSKWIDARPEWGKRYARAKQESAEADADNVNYIAELCLSGEIDPSVARVAIDAYKWSSGKKKPKKYGDMVKIDYNQIDDDVKPDVDFDDIKL
ncbi:MAG: hypothetical protein GX638_13605 [Crenarchaeota archaeon]|nr:hypothetical protein [Thermoproteota archaeon]